MLAILFRHKCAMMLQPCTLKYKSGQSDCLTVNGGGTESCSSASLQCHDDVIKWKHFLDYWPFVWGIHRSPVNSPHKGQWCRALMFSLICIWINGWVNNREAGDLRRYHAHYDVIVMALFKMLWYYAIKRCFPNYWLFVRGIHELLVDSLWIPHTKGW